VIASAADRLTARTFTTFLCQSEDIALKTRLLLLAMTLSFAALAHAQGGCVNSPECPTAVLGVVGVAAVAIARRLKR